MAETGQFLCILCAISKAKIRAYATGVYMRFSDISKYDDTNIETQILYDDFNQKHVEP